MRPSGFTIERAADHERAQAVVFAELDRRGYPVSELAVKGHRPDGRLDDGDYVEVKTGTPKLVIELDSLQEYRTIELRERRRVHIVHVPVSDGATIPPVDSWHVHTPDSVRIIGGPRRHSGSGSNDEWYRCDPAGTRFDDYFPFSEAPF